MTRFSTDQLTTFATVIEYGTFDAAADILRVSPSAISQRIKAMEQIAGKVLLRRSNPVTPTDAGQSVLRIARQHAGGLRLVRHDPEVQPAADAADCRTQ